MLGPIVEYVGESKLPYGMVPIMLYNGEITLQTQSGRIQTQILDTHTALYTESLEDMTVEEVRRLCLSIHFQFTAFSLSVILCPNNINWGIQYLILF